MFPIAWLARKAVAASNTRVRLPTVPQGKQERIIAKTNTTPHLPNAGDSLLHPFACLPADLTAHSCTHSSRTEPAQNATPSSATGTSMRKRLISPPPHACGAHPRFLPAKAPNERARHGALLTLTRTRRQAVANALRTTPRRRLERCLAVLRAS